MKTLWLMGQRNEAMLEWIDANLIATTYQRGRSAIIVTFDDETDWLMFRLRWT